MIIINETENLKEQCYCNPAFEMLFQRISIVLKYASLVKDAAGQWVEQAISGFIPTKNKEINDQWFIDPATRVLTSEQTDGTYPAYSYILGTQIKSIIPNWDNLTKEEIGELYLYNLVGGQVEAIAVANSWQTMPEA